LEIKLKNNHAFKWKTSKGLSVKGDFNEEVTLKSNNLVNHFINNKDSFGNLLKNNNHFFSVVLETEKYVYAAVDHLRMYPLFYSIKNGCAYLSDDANWILQRVQNIEMDELSATEFLMTGYVTGSDTLYPDVKQLQAGEYLTFNRIENSIEVKMYSEIKINEGLNFDKQIAFNKLDQIHIGVFERLIESLNGRTAVLPLSGGYDSRVIAMMLKRLGYENVICFTYGKPGNWEAKVSKEIADLLEYQWFFVSYTPEKWKRWFASDARKKYFDISNGLTSLAHIQDHMAIGELKEKGLIPEDSVIIPGHTAMLSFGGYNQNIRGIKQATSAIVKKHYSLWSWSYKKSDLFKGKLEEKVYHAIEAFEDKGQTIENSIFLWELRERHAKFICNSVRAYEQFGYEWRMPLWEKEMVEFWLNVPHEYRINKVFYKEYFNNQFVSGKKTISNPNAENENVRFKPFKDKIKKNALIYETLIKVNKTSTYYKHPLDWYKIISYPEYLKGLVNGADNINSYLVERQKDMIKLNNRVLI